MNLNSVIGSIAPSVTLGITSKAKAMKAEGRNVISFAAGEPDFDTPECIKKACADALQRGETKYAPVSGLLELRKEISAKFEKDNSLNYTPDQITVANGAKHSLFNVFMALCSAGDEVIIPAPYWLSYPEFVKFSGATPVVVNCTEDNDYKLTPAAFEAAVTDRTKAIVLNSPSNPIGVVYSRSELEALAEVAVRHGIVIIADDIYEKLIYDDVEHVSIASLGQEVYDLTVTVNGFSKAYSMTGWRLGYLAAPMKLVKAINAFQSHSTSGANTFAQYGAIEALRSAEPVVKDMVKAFQERRNLIYNELCSIDGLSCVKPMGAFYALPSIAKLGIDSVSFAEQLLAKHEVALVPGLPFGADGNIRLSYACGLDDIREGVGRLKDFVKSL